MPKAILVAGLLYGDESKGATVEKLSAEYHADLVVRYNGGAQAAHNVVLSDGRHHTFQQFTCGTFQRIPTFLSRFHRVDFLEMHKEAQELESKGVMNPLSLMCISSDALVVTPMHYIGDDRWREQHRISTCGMGVGEAKWYAERFPDSALYVRDFAHPSRALGKLIDMQMHYDTLHLSANDIFLQMLRVYNLCQVWDEAYSRIAIRNTNTVIFEGAQGVQLDERRGTIPYVTSSNTTFENAEVLLREAGWDDTVEVWGCIRTYATRHGDGPLPSEVNVIGMYHPESHNRNNPFQGRWRTGMLDWPTLRRSLDIIDGVDYIALSHLDCVAVPEHSIQQIADQLGVSVGMVGYGPKASDRRMLR